MAAHDQYTISAIYEGGQFRPLEQASLPEHTRVTLTVEVADDPVKTEDERVRAIFAAAGVPLVPRAAYDGRRPMNGEGACCARATNRA